TFDALNRLTTQQGPFLINGTPFTVTYVYDRTSDGFPQIEIGDSLGGWTVSGYDAGNRLAYKVVNDAIGDRTRDFKVSLNYNLDNQVTTVAYWRGTSTPPVAVGRFSYDVYGRGLLTGIDWWKQFIYPGQDNQKLDALAYTYDVLGRLT